MKRASETQAETRSAVGGPVVPGGWHESEEEPAEDADRSREERASSEYRRAEMTQPHSSAAGLHSILNTAELQ